MSAGTPVGQHRAEIHDQQVIGKVHHKVHVVLDQQQAHALASQLIQHRASACFSW